MSRDEFVFEYEYHNHSSCSLEARMLSSPHSNTMGLNTWRKSQLQMSSGFQDCLAVANMEFVLVVLGSRFCTRANERGNAVFYYHERNVALGNFVSTRKNYMHHLISIHLP